MARRMGDGAVMPLEPRGSGRQTPAAGFTLIEMIIVLVILTTVCSIVSAMVVKALHDNVRATSTRAAVTQSLGSMRTLATDLATAQSPDRDSGQLPNLDALRKGVHESAAVTNIGHTRLDVRDIVRAGPSILEFRADVDHTGDPSLVVCIRYEVRLASDGKVSLFRDVYPNTQAPAAPNTCAGSATPTTSERLVEQVQAAS